jgi:hypothetical protein
MKNYGIALSFALTAIVLTACNLNLDKDEKNDGKVELKPIRVNEEYSMGVPGYMTKATTLNEGASLQFQNVFKETYVIVIDEDKQEFLDAYETSSVYDTARSLLSNYSDTQLQLTTSEMDVINMKELTRSRINGLKAESTEIDAKVEGISFPITYFLTFIEGENKFYFIMAWTLQEKKDAHRPAFQQMVRSFRLLKSKDRQKQ